VTGAFALTGWRPGRTLLLLGAALIAGAAADGFLLYGAVTGIDVQTTLMASLWPASALLAGFAAWQPVGGGIPRLSGTRLVVAPVVFAGAAVGLQAYAVVVEPVNQVALMLATAALVAAVLRMAATLRENALLLERSRRDALVDPLTGLENRRKLMLDLRRVTHDMSPAAPIALMLFDLDGFKQYNDRYGHPAGDALLTRLGRKLTGAMGREDRAYRLGGDEFCVLGHGSRDRLCKLATRAQASLADKGPGVQVASSCGMVLLPDETEDITLALKLADERLYADKVRRQTVESAVAG
jgi:two-component system, cell cycle response regulator